MHGLTELDQELKKQFQEEFQVMQRRVLRSEDSVLQALVPPEDVSSDSVIMEIRQGTHDQPEKQLY